MINILSKEIYNRISAGEVVEKPASVVKEMLDNSIDAKATEISVKILDGGIKQIIVEDNGEGISPEDFPKVFLPHATSKIKLLEDLEKIGTLGFRGEALASISAVSKVTLISKPKNQVFAQKINVSAGIIGDIQECGGKDGTTFIVDDIFYNVPARAKFLRKPRAETTEITNLVERYILANPNISIKYYADEKLVYSSAGTGLEDAIYVVYGKETLQNIEKINYSSNNIKVSGYTSKPAFTKSNRTYQTLIVNGRYVVNSMVSACVYNVYEHYLLKNQFPFYIINLEIPLDELDVNVHPNKMDIRFENSNQIYGIIYSAISQTLHEYGTTSAINNTVFDYKKHTSGISFVDSSIQNSQENTADVKCDKICQSVPAEEVEQNSENAEKVGNDEDKTSNISSLNFSNFIDINKETHFSNGSLKELKMHDPAGIIKINEIEPNSTNVIMQDEQILENSNNAQNVFFQKEKVEQSSFIDNLKYIGSAFNTYLIWQNQTDLYFIDQHAAHERLLYDKFVEQYNNKNITTQILLLPYSFTVNALEKEFILTNEQMLMNLGFGVEIFGENMFRVSSIPAILVGLNINELFNDLLKDLISINKNNNADLILEKIMQKSCKHAVKGGDELSFDEANLLINNFKKDKNQLTCPHGRPILIKITKTELEKLFYRKI